MSGVRLKDVNGPRGGGDHVCRIKVVLRNLPSVVYEKQDASPDAAFGDALAGAERSEDGTPQRSRLRARASRKKCAPYLSRKACWRRWAALAGRRFIAA